MMIPRIADTFHLAKHRLCKLCGRTRYVEKRCGIKAYNKCVCALFPELFAQKITVHPGEVLLGFDGLKDAYTLLDTPISASPHYEIAQRIAQGRDIAECDYVRREQSGTLDGRFASSVPAKKHVDAFRRTAESLREGSYALPIVYELDRRLYAFDGKHRLAVSALIGRSIDCYLIDPVHIAKQGYVSGLFRQMTGLNGYSKNYAHLKRLSDTLRNKKKVLVINRNQTDNLGDMAIGFAMMKLFSDQGAVVQLAEFSNVRATRGIKIVEKPDEQPTARGMISRLKNNRLLRAAGKLFLKRSLYLPLREGTFDTVLVGGGELLQSNKTFPSALDHWTKAVRSFNPSARLYLFAVGAAASYSEEDRHKVQRALSRVDGVYCRDEQSRINLYNNFCIEAKVIIDVVFYFMSADVSNRTRDKWILFGVTDYARVKKYGKLADSKTSYYDLCYRDILELKKRFPDQDIRLFFTTTADYRACREFCEYVDARYHDTICIAETPTLTSLIDAYREAVCVVSPRMHGCILAMTEGVPNVIPIALSPKLESFIRICDTLPSTEEIRAILKEAASETLIIPSRG